MPSKPRCHIQSSATISLPDGSEVITTYNEKENQHILQCPRCEANIILHASANPQPMLKHFGSATCKKKEEKLAEKLSNFTQFRKHSLAPTTSPKLNRNLFAYGLPPKPYIPANAMTPLLPPTHHHANEVAQKCLGLPVHWEIGSVWKTYPYRMHADMADVSWKPIFIDDETNTITFRSKKCWKQISGEIDGETVCSECWKIPTKFTFKSMVERAKEAHEHTPWLYLTIAQMEKTMKQMVSQLRYLRSTANNRLVSVQIALARIDDYKQIMMLIATNDFCHLRQLISVSLRHGCSPEAIVDRLNRAIEGLYSPRGGFTQRELDVSFLTQHIGGPRLLYALQHSKGLASASTIGRNYNPPQLRPSSGIPSSTEVITNITSFFTPELKPPPVRVNGRVAGNVLMFDGIAIESKCRYSPSTGEIIGLCREHSGNVSVKISDEETFQKIWSALGEKESDKKVCFGVEATVVAVAPYGQDVNYTPIPIVLSPSDKTEKSDQLTSWIQVVFDTWGEKASNDYGSLWSIASDGDATFRRARHNLCVKHQLAINTPLGAMLRPLKGLNCYTSKELIVATCDPKHILKRDGTLLRSPTGIMLGDTHILPNDLFTALQSIHGLSKNEAEDLMDPTDKQNVPKAVTLLRLVDELRSHQLPVDEFQQHQTRRLSQIAEFFSLFYKPFISPDMSLTEQLISLIAYAHIAAALWIEHGADCLTGPLYADSQAVVKNIIFVTARLQLIDPNTKFYILHEGTDRLERLFSDCRTLDHSRNVDARQLSEKMGIIAMINLIYERNPELDRASRCLSLKDVYGMDHLNPRSWRGNVCVGDVVLQDAWKEGRVMAEVFLVDVYGKEMVDQKFNFEKLFADETCDLLRPEGTYVGLKASESDYRTEDRPADPHAALNQHPTEINADDLEALDSLEDGSEVVYEGGGELSLEDFIPALSSDQTDSNSGQLSEKSRNRHTMEVQGKTVYIDSIVSSISPRHWRSFANRTFRVQGHAIEDFGHSKLSYLVDRDEVASALCMKAYDVVCCLVHSEDIVCLVLMVVKGFSTWKGKTKYLHPTAKYDDLKSSQSSIIVYGQIIKIAPSTLMSDYWEWSNKFIGFDHNGKKTGNLKTTKNRSTIGVASYLVHPIEPSIISHHAAQPKERLRWTISSEKLEEHKILAWEMLQSQPNSTSGADNLAGNTVARHHTVHKLLPLKDKNDLPYKSEHNVPSFVIVNALGFIKPRDPTVKLNPRKHIPCLVCGEIYELAKMREHVSTHILRGLRGQMENDSFTAKMGSTPCGWCGLDNGCSTILIKNINLKSDNLEPKITSDCPYHHQALKYNAVQESETCTNIPIHCDVCSVSAGTTGEPVTIWKYNALLHAMFNHPVLKEVELNGQVVTCLAPGFSASMKELVYISKQEELTMGINAEHTMKAREDYDLPRSDDIHPVTPSRNKRDRTDTISNLPENKRRR